ncbi:MAG TPA: hypothetical protein VIZ30_04780, partial [Pseudomonadales bacterium]
MVLLSLGALAGCRSNGAATAGSATLNVEFNDKGCPLPFRPDTSCANVPNVPKPDDTVCRTHKEKIAWQAVDRAGVANRNIRFEVRFREAQQILEDDFWWPARCSISKDGSLRCRVKKG